MVAHCRIATPHAGCLSRRYAITTVMGIHAVYAKALLQESTLSLRHEWRRRLLVGAAMSA